MRLDKLKVKPSYAQAVHTATFLLLDNQETLIAPTYPILTGKDVSKWKEENEKYFLELFHHILSEYNYELSSRQATLAAYSYLYFLNHIKHKQC